MLSARRMFLGTRRHTGILDRRIRQEQAKYSKTLERSSQGRAGARSAEPAEIKAARAARAAAGRTCDSPAAKGFDAPCEPVEVYEASSRAAGNNGSIEFADIVSPFAPQAFFTAQAETPRPMLFRGPPARFEHLMGWRDIDKLLFSGRRDASRIRLFMDRQTLPASLVSRPSEPFGHQLLEPAIDDRKLLAFLREGATLIVDRVHRSLGRVSDLTDAFAGAAHHGASANLYVSWQSTQGFNTHWDDHDVFVVQVRGEKHWRIYGVTRVSPLKRDIEENGPAPKEPIWTGRLGAGDVLFIPRGWWHDARGVPGQGRASMHLSCHVGVRTGSDVMDWLTRRMMRQESFRRELPLLAGEPRLVTHIEALRKSLTSLLRGRTPDAWAKELKDEFRTGRAWDAGARTGPSLEPWACPDWQQYVLRLRGQAHCTLRHDRTQGAVHLAANGAKVEFDPYCLPLVQLLAGREVVTVQELKELDPGRFAGKFVDDFLKPLIRGAVVSAAGPQ